MIQKMLLLSVLLIKASACICQVPHNQFKITSPDTSFPDTGKTQGHVYNNVLYNAADHYSDSSVIIITPKYFKDRKKADMIFWFHG